MSFNSFGSQAHLSVSGQRFDIHRLDAVYAQHPDAVRLPFSTKILLENLLRTEDGHAVRADDIEAVARWRAKAEPTQEIAFTPARVLLQDFTGVPAVVDLAAMREAMVRLGGDPKTINPLQPVELVIDHSVQVDFFGGPHALEQNAELEFSRNRERYRFLKWGQQAFANFRCVPPDTGIVHQVNLEFLARVVMAADGQAYPDTLVGTDSHTTMINGLGCLGWGVGGIEAEAAMLGQPVSMLLPQVIGVRLSGQLPEGATATDLVLTVTQMLRKHGVVGKFVEFFGNGVLGLPLADRATIANMAPEYGATCGIFPIDAETLRYLRFSGRPEEQVALVEAYAKEQGLFLTVDAPEASYTEVLALDLATVEPSLAGPLRPQDRVRLSAVKSSFDAALADYRAHQPLPAPTSATRDQPPVRATSNLGELDAAGKQVGNDQPRPRWHASPIPTVTDGSVVICAITSCTNTSNPIGVGGRGIGRQKSGRTGPVGPALGQDQPGARLPGGDRVPGRLRPAGLPGKAQLLHRRLRLHHLHRQQWPACHRRSREAIADGDLMVAAVLSGNRNFEGRVHPEVRANYLASPPLVVAYALAGRIDIDLTRDRLGRDPTGQPGLSERPLADASSEVAETVEQALDAGMFRVGLSPMFHRQRRLAFAGRAGRRSVSVRAGFHLCALPPYFADMGEQPEPDQTVTGARGCWRCSATASPPITSRRPVRSSETARPGAI
jgi:aconitate hydratase